MLEAVSHAAEIGTGDTRPQVFWCSETPDTMSRWVLKLMGLANGELAADWIGSAMAHRLGLPCPEIAIANVDAEAMDTAPASVRSWAVPGPAFASREFTRTTNIQSDSDLLDFATGEDLGRIFILDAWLDVLDRRKPDGTWNALARTDQRNILVIDFGKGLSQVLLPSLGGPMATLPDYPPHVRQRASIPAATELCDIIEAVGDREITDIVGSVPSVWIEASARNRFVQFLVSRAGRLKVICQSMHSETPTW